MELKLVSFELAKKLKGVGFNAVVLNFYDQDKSVSKSSNKELFDWNNEDIRHNALSATTLELARMWFREKHKIYITSNNDSSINPFYQYQINHEGNEEYEDYVDYSTYESALAAGLFEACKILTNQNN